MRARGEDGRPLNPVASPRALMKKEEA